MPNCRCCGSDFELGSRFCQDCGADLPCVTSPRLPAWMEPSDTVGRAAPAACLPPPPKSLLVASLLAVFFGPFGMIYSTFLGALVMLTASAILAGFTQGTSLLFTWPACVLWSVIAARIYNEDRR
jgi:hypothetical protein